MRRYGMTIRLRPGFEAEYRRFHRDVWPEVLATIAACNLRNYTIFLNKGVLFGYFSQSGDNFSADMAKMAADPKTQEWWTIMQPMQEPSPDRAEGDWWTTMAEVFHTD